MQHAAWPAHKASCKVATKAQAALDDLPLLNNATKLRQAVDSLASADAAGAPPLEPTATARLFLLRHLLSEREDAAGRIAHAEHSAAFRLLARTPAALSVRVSCNSRRPVLLREVILSGAHNWTLHCIRWCLAGSRALPAFVLEVLRALTFGEAQPPFIRFMAAWALASSLQFPESTTEEGNGPIDQTIAFLPLGSPQTDEMIRCHAFMEEIAPAARAEAPEGLEVHVDAALAEAVVFNKKIRSMPAQ
jgi:hypothetical protein